ncbi:hypothetical protein CBM2623_A190033 [Cupriavidus taiwanensis]|nr:hypothetical protein CBM2608_A180034 [Cupriavidus taiwanensis]SPA26845.1 hypothetical protein CBM2623_A190033 [Cupriavidus taiwanensis]SPA44545.1 hypothetical protein CBM2629_A150347 [Cupriavidus taiwanensis]
MGGAGYNSKVSLSEPFTLAPTAFHLPPPPSAPLLPFTLDVIQKACRNRIRPHRRNAAAAVTDPAWEARGVDGSVTG